jgi:glycosyltransferase involved in cell wall biosynthesis
MHIAVCGPISLRMLKEFVQGGESLPSGYACPLIATIVQRYIQQGHFVTIVTCSTDVDLNHSWKGQQCNIFLVPSRKRVRWQVLDCYRDEVRCMRDILQNEKPDVIHAMWTYEFADAALGTGIPTLVTAHDSPWRIAIMTRQVYRFFRAIYSQIWVLPRAKYLSAVSTHIVNDLRWYHGYLGTIHLVPNGIRSGFDTHVNDVSQSVVDPVIVVVSEWGRLKNVQMSIQAFLWVRKRFSTAKLILYGSGLGKEQAAENWCRESLISTEGICFRGYCAQEEITEVLQKQATLFLHTSLEESFCMTILEAMSQGVACVGGLKSGAVPWLLDNGRAGVLVDVKSSVKLAEAVTKLIDNRSVRERLARAGYERAGEMFSMESVVGKYIGLLEKIRVS